VRLRGRLVLTVVIISAVLLAVLLLVERTTENRALRLTLEEVALTHMQQGGRERCEASPSDWSAGRLRRPPRPPPDHLDGPPPGAPPPPPVGPDGLPEPPPGRRGGAERLFGEVQLFAYDAQGVSANPLAPSLPPGEDELQRVELDGQEVVQVRVYMPWTEGPCAQVLARRALPGSPPPGPRGRRPPPPDRMPSPWVLIALSLGVTGGAVFLAMGPLVRRLHRLTTRVRSLARADYLGEVAEPGNDEVAELSRAFDAAAREIRSGLEQQEQRERALREFLENTTHDVNIPLTVLMGHLAALRERLERGEPPERERLGSAIDEAHHIGALIHNLTLVARLDAGTARLTRSRVDLNEVVRRCAARIRPVAKEAQVALESATPEAPTWVDADVTLVEQAVGNLLSNAVRHNLPGRHAALILDVVGERFELRVLDDGPGIPPEELSSVMERHARGNAARTRNPSGRGLGLSITAQVAQAHGWDFRLGASEEGGVEAVLGGPMSPH